jgi:hypothetical protein
MKPFDLEAALAGAKVMNGRQEPVTDIAYFPSRSSMYKVCAVINGEIKWFTAAGCLFKTSTNAFLDLFMAPVKREGWINIYKSGYTNGHIYKTEEDARALASPGPIAYVRIEWEE